MTTEEINEYYTYVHNLLISAGEMMREGYFNQKSITTKTAYYDLVTEYDMKIEQHLMNNITTKYPDHKFIGEESAAADKKIPELTDSPTWIIDPIDGTSNFIKMLPHTCISLGLAINKELVMGLIFNPIANEFYTARKGQGAFLNGHRINCSDVQELKKAILGYEISLVHAPAVKDMHMKRIYQLAPNVTGTRSFGCAALSLCYVAKGSLDCYHVEGLQPWDMAAGVVIIREAGGYVCHALGGEFDVMNPAIVCGSTETLCREMVERIKRADNSTISFE